MKNLSAKKTAALVIGAAMCAAGLAAWVYQLVQGMHVTNLRNSFTWGLYMGSFEFFIAMATGGILVFSMAYLWNIEVLKPFVKIAVIGSLASVVAAGVAIFEDLGEPFHALYMIITPNVGSPLFWDVIILTLYVIVCVVAVLLTLLPDTKKNFHNRGYRMTNEENLPDGISGQHRHELYVRDAEYTRVVAQRADSGQCLCGSHGRGAVLYDPPLCPDGKT